MTPPISLRMLLLATATCTLSVGCGEPPPIRTYVVASENEQEFTSELLRRDYPPIPFRWSVPSSWSLATNDQFSLRAWNAGPPAEQARITLGRFPAGAGVEAQVARWRRQLELPPDANAMKDVENLKTQNGDASYATLTGKEETILALILPIDAQMWILRFRGQNSTAKVEGDGFRRFCESLEYVAPASDAKPQVDPAADPDNSSKEPDPAAADEPADTDDSTQEPAEQDAAADSPQNTESDSDDASSTEASQPEGEE